MFIFYVSAIRPPVILLPLNKTILKKYYKNSILTHSKKTYFHRGFQDLMW